MKPLPRLRLEPSPSRIGCAAIGAACAATSILLAMLPLPTAGYIAGGCAVLAVLASGLWRCTGRGVPAIVHVGLDRRITVTDRGGRSRSGAILDHSYVGALLTTIVWQPDGAPWWRPAPAILVLPDTLPADDFRRLRVALRYGRAPVAAATSGVDAH
jgi:hypothetical protein